MKRLILIIAIILVATSCVTYKKCVEKFQIKSDTIRTVTYRDTIIKVPILGTDTLYAWALVHDTLIVNNGTAHAITYVVHDTIHTNVWQSDTILKVRLDSAIKVIDTKEKQVITITQKAKLTKILWQIISGLAIVALMILIPRVFKKK
jgi:hypothetical protein